MKDDRVKVSNTLLFKRAELSAEFSRLGLGIGTLVKINSRWAGDKATGIVRDVDWKTASSSDSFTLLVLDLNSRERWCHTNLDVDAWNKVEVLSPVTSRHVEGSMPSNWVDGTLYVEDDFFEKGQPRRSYLFGEEW